MNLVDRVNAVVLSGGSAYGLDAAQGVVRFLEERGIGWKIGASGVVPIVPAAILFDLPFGGNPKIRPTADCGYRAADAATADPVSEGNVGAGAGATVGKMGMGRSMKGGLGSAAITLPNGLVVAAIVAVNAVGDIVDPTNGQIVAGLRSEDGKSLADTRKLLRSGALLRRPAPRAGENTTIGLVATNARLTKTEVNRLALMADDGLAKAIVPSHTVGDGDTLFALATGRWTGEAHLTLLGAMAAEAMAEAIVRAASKAESLNGVPAARELGTVPARLK
jgi:L-aminopeptidase/D-esterase-like protein